MIGGTLHVGIHRRGALPIWHLTDHQLSSEQAGTTVAYLAGAEGYNRVTVQYTDIANEYPQKPESANNEFNQNARSLRPDTLNMPSIGRAGHAAAIARIVIDQASAARRHVETNIDHLAYLFTPGDILEFTHAGSASVALKCRLALLAEGQDKRVQISAIEHSPTLDMLRNSVISPPPGCVGEDCEPDEDDPGDTDPGTCEEARGERITRRAWKRSTRLIGLHFFLTAEHT